MIPGLHPAGRLADGPRRSKDVGWIRLTFVMPNVNGTVAEENLGGDGYNVQVTRNVQAHCALYGHSPKLLVQLLDPGHVIFFNPCEELLDAGEIYVDTYCSARPWRCTRRRRRLRLRTSAWPWIGYR